MALANERHGCVIAQLFVSAPELATKVRCANASASFEIAAASSRTPAVKERCQGMTDLPLDFDEARHLRPTA
jgi:hypothetical protein